MDVSVVERVIRLGAGDDSARLRALRGRRDRGVELSRLRGVVVPDRGPDDRLLERLRVDVEDVRLVFGVGAALVRVVAEHEPEVRDSRAGVREERVPDLCLARSPGAGVADHPDARRRCGRGGGGEELIRAGPERRRRRADRVEVFRRGGETRERDLVLGRREGVVGEKVEARRVGPVADAAVRRGVGAPADVDRGRRAELKVRAANDVRSFQPRQLEVEADVRARLVRLVDLDRDRVRAGDERGRGERGREERRLVGHAQRNRRERRVRDGARRHVVAADLGAVQVDDRAVVAKEPQRERGVVRRARDGERAAEIRRDVLRARVRSVRDDRRLVSVAVAELRGARRPERVVEGGRAPRGSLVRSVVLVLPRRPLRDEDVGRGRAQGGREENEGGGDRGEAPHRESPARIDASSAAAARVPRMRSGSASIARSASPNAARASARRPPRSRISARRRSHLSGRGEDEARRSSRARAASVLASDSSSSSAASSSEGAAPRRASPRSRVVSASMLLPAASIARAVSTQRSGSGLGATSRARG